MANLARTVAAWIFTVVYWIAALLVYLAAFGQIPEKMVSKTIRLWGRTTLRLLSVRLELLNPNPFDVPAPRVVICNHQSALDLVWGAAICPRSPLAIGKKEIIYVPVINLVWWALDFIRIDRKNPDRATASLEGVAREIRDHGRSIILAPEGTRSPDGSLLPFKKGAFHIAIQSGAPIYPIVVTGAHECLPKSAYLPRPGVIRIHFLPKIETLGLTPDHVNELCERSRSVMETDYSERVY